MIVAGPVRRRLQAKERKRRKNVQKEVMKVKGLHAGEEAKRNHREDKAEGSEGRTNDIGEGTKWEGSMGKMKRNKGRKKGQKVKGMHVGEGTKWEGSMRKTTRKKVRKEGKKRKRNTRRRRN
jgi:hypothetical protein